MWDTFKLWKTEWVLKTHVRARVLCLTKQSCHLQTSKLFSQYSSGHKENNVPEKIAFGYILFLNLTN